MCLFFRARSPVGARREVEASSGKVGRQIRPATHESGTDRRLRASNPSEKPDSRSRRCPEVESHTAALSRRERCHHCCVTSRLRVLYESGRGTTAHRRRQRRHGIDLVAINQAATQIVCCRESQVAARFARRLGRRADQTELSARPAISILSFPTTTSEFVITFRRYGDGYGAKRARLGTKHDHRPCLLWLRTRLGRCARHP